MRRIFVSALLASALYVPASADPLQIAPDSYAANQSANGGRAVRSARRAGRATLRRGARAQSRRRLHRIPVRRPGAAVECSARLPAGARLSTGRGCGAERHAKCAGVELRRAEPGQTAHAPIDPKYDRQVVAYDGDEHPGTIIIDTPHRFLYLVEAGGKALRYGIGVGRPGFTWSGVKTISAMREWPDWIPPDDMLKRRPDLPRYMAGGPENPLGARAMYLGSSLYRIHGSNEPWSIGQQVSSGCIRMRNDDVTDLYGRVKVGTKVVVI